MPKRHYSKLHDDRSIERERTRRALKLDDRRRLEKEVMEDVEDFSAARDANPSLTESSHRLGW
ncbi:hypothetical protein ACGFIU_01725 [Rhodococcus oryzae]|uniref:hypothetical protein n=1 Tax=Rhodococcus oryzae TaxID=2571143 RepID=UPI00371A6400